MNQAITQTNPQAITAQMRNDGLRFAQLAQMSFERHPRLAHENQDGTIFAPRIKLVHFVHKPDTDAVRFAVLIVDPEALYHDKLEWFDAFALQLLRVQFRAVFDRSSVSRLAPGTLVDLYGSQKAQDMVAYLVDLMPQWINLPERVTLPDPLTRDYLFIGTDGRRQIGGTRADLQSIMVAGESGSGKSTLLRSIAYQAGQHGWQVYLAEPATSHTWQREAWLRMPGVIDVQNDEAGIKQMLGKIEAEVEARSEKFSAYAAQHDGLPPEDIEEYNKAKGSEPMRPILIGIDEYLDFRHALFSDHLEEVTRKYRKFGVFLVIAAHNWQANSIPMSFGSLLHTRICLRVNDPYVGQATLHRNYHYGRQAAGLTARGRGLTLINGRLTEFQCYLLAKERSAAAMRPAAKSDGEEAPTAAPESFDGIDWELVRDMVQWTMDERRNGSRGKFSVRGVGEAFKDRLNPNYQKTFTALARRLEARGYLSPNESSSGRRVTDDLIKKVESLYG